MCGLAGMLSFTASRDSGIRVEKGIAALRHRGLQAPQTWQSPHNPVFLAHCRLAVIDLDRRADQPFTYRDRYRIVYNGELYNYKELREALLQKGLSFTTESDTEVIAAAWHYWGPDCLSRFDGMFAFAVWDDETGQLFAARDRFGEKPFFYAIDRERFCFASELKALFAMGASRQVNGSLLYNFLSFGYTTNPGDPTETFYTGIYKLPPASYLQTDLATRETTLHRYWQLDTAIVPPTNEAAAIEHFSSLLKASIRRRLRSDVAIGTSLSGGLDSSSIVAFCQEIGSAQYTHHCFTASYPGFEKDETVAATTVAARFGLQQTLVTTAETDIPGLMEKVMYYQEEPFSSASVLAQFGVYEAARRQGITVVLDGQGADEVLGGYHKYYRPYWSELYRQRLLKKGGELTAARSLGIEESFSLAQKAAALFPELAGAVWQSKKSRVAKRHPHLAPQFAAVHGRDSYYTLPLTSDLQGALFFNTTLLGLEELLRLADRNSMAHAVEVRLPFLSPELVQFSFSLPASYKIRNGWTKWILRQAVQQRLPESVVSNARKTGFEPPQQRWMEREDVTAAIQEGKRILVQQGVLRPEVLQQKVKPHAAHAADNRDWKYWSAAFLY